MKVLLINGSPHENGCTWSALKEVEKHLIAENIDTEILQIGKTAIQGCIACGKCFDNLGRCAFNDIVNIILEKAEKSDGFVFGSPVYYAGINGSFKALLDRLFFAGRCFHFKLGAAVVSARRAGTTVAFDQLNKYFLISQMPIVSSQYWNMVHGMNSKEAAQDLEGMQIMSVLGKNMAWLLKSIEAAKKAGINPPKIEQRQRTNFIR